MSLIDKLFRRRLVNRNEVVREMLKMRIREHPDVDIMGADEAAVDSFSRLILKGTPEATIAEIVETWVGMNRLGDEDEVIFERIEMYRNCVLPGGDMPESPDLVSYTIYRVRQEHQSDPSLNDAFLERAIEFARQRFSAR